MEIQSPLFLEDEMIRGDFKSFTHQHHFKQTDNGTIKNDLIDFESPYGALGKAVNKIYLKKYIETYWQKEIR